MPIKKTTIMLKVFLLLIALIPFSIYSQNTTEENIKKLRLEKSDVAFSKESFLLYPRGFIYSLNNPDSVYYLGCLSSDINNVKTYFEYKTTSKSPLNNNISRSCGDDSEIIRIIPLEDKIKQLTPMEGDMDDLIKKDTKHVIIYYWCNEMLDRFYNKNIKFLKRYASKNSKKGIQVIFVSTDKFKS